MKSEILNFINNFNQFEGVIPCFTEGNCYYFAVILAHRFPEGSEIVYDPVQNHFACEIADKVYDITGEVTNDGEWISWALYKLEDPTHAKRIERDCILCG